MKKFGPVRHSERSAFKQCPRKLYWSRVVGIQPTRASPALVIGSAFHKGLEHWRSKEGSIGDAFDAACEYLVDNLGASDQQLEDECARVKAYIMGYTAAYADDLQHDWAIEQNYKTTQDAGTIDAWMRDKNGNVWIVDDKTRSQLTQDLHLIVQLDEQLMNYACLLEAKKIGPVVGASIRETKKAGIKRTKKEDAVAYADRVMSLYKSGSKELFVDATVMFKPEKLEAFKQMRTFENERIKANVSKKTTVNDWPYNYNACTGKYGNCSFLHACNGTGNDTIYEPTEQEPLDDGQGREEIFGYSTAGTATPTATRDTGRSSTLPCAPI